MIAALRTVLVGLLTATVAYCLVTVYSLITQANGCINSEAVIAPPCRTLLRHLTVPGHHEATVAFLCGAASMLVTVTAPRTPGRVPPGVPRRLMTWGEAVAVAAILTLAALRIDPALHGLADDVAIGAALLLAWFLGRYVARLWAELDTPTGGEAEPRWIARHRLLSLTLTGIILAMGSAAIVAKFAVWRPTFRDLGAALATLPPGPVAPHVAPQGVGLCAAAFAVGAAILLVLVHYVSLRPRTIARPVVGGKGLAVRWLLACSLLLAGLLLVAVAAPIVSEGAAGAVGGLYGAIAGPAGTTSDHRSCRNDRSLCGKSPRTDGGNAIIPHHKHEHHRRAPNSDVTGAIVRFALWLVPLVPVLYFTWERGLRARTTHLLSQLAALWRRFRLHSARLRAALEARLPSALADLGASAALTRHGRAARLPSREQVVAYYLNAVGYATRHGIVRHTAQTPEEFEQTLRRHLDTGNEAWATLTADFIAARYSLDPLPGKRPERARLAWHATRAAIRATTRARSGPEE